MSSQNMTAATSPSSLRFFAAANPGRAAALIAGIVALVVIVAALILQYGFGYAPCPLCLEQRWPYYIGVPLTLLFFAFGGNLPRAVRFFWLAVIIALFIDGCALGVYQAGAEWGYWMGPNNCAAGNIGGNPASVGGLLSAIQTSTVVSCTDPRLRIFGVSLAGWNAVVMAFLVLLMLLGLRGEAKRQS